MKKTFLLFSLCILFYSGLKAEDYHIGIGARFGKFNNGVTYKQFFQAEQNIGMEFQLYYAKIADTYGYNFKGFILDQIGFKVPVVQLPLDFIIGGAIQVGYFPYDAPGYYKLVDGKADYYGKSVLTAGLAANIGLEYQLKRSIAPVSIGIDCVPAFEFLNKGPEWFDFGVDIRYIIR